jgi:hypothetical protein
VSDVSCGNWLWPHPARQTAESHRPIVVSLHCSQLTWTSLVMWHCIRVPCVYHGFCLCITWTPLHDRVCDMALYWWVHVSLLSLFFMLFAELVRTLRRYYKDIFCLWFWNKKNSRQTILTERTSSVKRKLIVVRGRMRIESPVWILCWAYRLDVYPVFSMLAFWWWKY